MLKVDRSFITELETGDVEIVRTIMTLAHGMGMQVVAEGIESREQLAKLQNYGCGFGQGYLFSKPLIEDYATRILQKLYEADKNSPADNTDQVCHLPGIGARPMV